MTRGALFLAVLFVCVSTGVAAAASNPSVTARGPVAALAADGDMAAFVAPTPTDCDRAFIWQRLTRRTYQFGKKQQCAGQRGVAGIAVSGGRALWLTWFGDTMRVWRLFTATTTKTTPRQLQPPVSTDATAPQPIVVGRAGGGLLPYAVGSTVTVLRTNGTRAFAPWTAPGRVVALAARDGHVAVATEGARVTVLDSRGNILSVDLYASEVSAVDLAAKGQLVQRGNTLEFRRQADTHQFAVPAGARLADADAKWAAWSDGKLVHVIRLPDGASRGTYAGAWAAVSGNRLYVANGRKITFRTIH